MQECLNCQGTGLQPNESESLAGRTQLCPICGGSGQVSDGEQNVVTPETEEAENADPVVTGTDVENAPVEDDAPTEPEAPVEQTPDQTELSPEEAQAQLENQEEANAPAEPAA